MQRILGNSYGQLIYESLWQSDVTSADPFRFCYRDHEHPEYPKLVTGDVNGKVVSYRSRVILNVQLIAHSNLSQVPRLLVHVGK